MTPAERAQATALLTQAEAMRDQGAALMHLAEAQIRATNALFAAEPPMHGALSAEGLAVAEKIFGEPPKARHYGSRPNPPGLDVAGGGVRPTGPE